MSRRTGVPTLRDIANEVGVSAMAVSSVINGGRSATRVSEVTRERIREAALRLGYRPNAEAQALSRHRFDKLGGVVETDGNDTASISSHPDANN